jgi:hypothetical protein
MLKSVKLWRHIYENISVTKCSVWSEEREFELHLTVCYYNIFPVLVLWHEIDTINLSLSINVLAHFVGNIDILTQCIGENG